MLHDGWAAAWVRVQPVVLCCMSVPLSHPAFQSVFTLTIQWRQKMSKSPRRTAIWWALPEPPAGHWCEGWPEGLTPSSGLWQTWQGLETVMQPLASFSISDLVVDAQTSTGSAMITEITGWKFWTTVRLHWCSVSCSSWRMKKLTPLTGPHAHLTQFNRTPVWQVLCFGISDVTRLHLRLSRSPAMPWSGTWRRSSRRTILKCCNDILATWTSLPHNLCLWIQPNYVASFRSSHITIDIQHDFVSQWDLMCFRCSFIFFWAVYISCDTDAQSWKSFWTKRGSKI